jgi:hypothetical protein
LRGQLLNHRGRRTMARQPTSSRKRVAGPTNDAVIDLRPASTTVHEPALIELEALRDALDDPIDRALLPVDLVTLDLTSGGTRSLDADDPRQQRWSQLLESFRALDEPAAYVGSFHRRLDTSIELATALGAEDRRPAALLVLDRTARYATNDREFRHGIVRARELDPSAFAAPAAVSTVLRGSLLHRHEPPRMPAVAFGLPVTLELLAGAPRPAIGLQDRFALRAALAQLPPERLAVLPKLAERLHPDDRHVLHGLLFGERPSRRWPWQRRRRRSRR